tara:strand:+ start:83 stop:514 length:432 start_codon:yes stop_codon:yes gene_type:complete
MAGKKHMKGKIHGNVGKRHIKSYSKETGYEYFKNKAEMDKFISKKNIKATRARIAKLTKKVPKASIAKRVLGKTLSKAIPGAGVAMAASEIVKMVKDRKAKPIKGKSCPPGKSKVTTGGKTYCVAGMRKIKKGSKVKDPISKR